MCSVEGLMKEHFVLLYKFNITNIKKGSQNVLYILLLSTYHFVTVCGAPTLLSGYFIEIPQFLPQLMADVPGIILTNGAVSPEKFNCINY